MMEKDNHVSSSYLLLKQLIHVFKDFKPYNATPKRNDSKASVSVIFRMKPSSHKKIDIDPSVNNLDSFLSCLNIFFFYLLSLYTF